MGCIFSDSQGYISTVNRKLRMAVCIVTGVAGFVGSHLAEKLLD